MNPFPYAPNPDFQARQDGEHLRLLSIGYFIWAGLGALFGLFPIVHILMGLSFLNGQFPLSPTGSIVVNGKALPGFPSSPVPNTFPGSSSSPAPSAFPGSPTVSVSPGAPPPLFGWMFVVMGTFAIIFMETLAFLSFVAGRCLAKRRGKTWIQVVAALSCLSVPFGTLLGVFTFIVLSRPSVASLFDSQP